MSSWKKRKLEAGRETAPTGDPPWGPVPPSEPRCATAGRNLRKARFNVENTVLERLQQLRGSPGCKTWALVGFFVLGIVLAEVSKAEGEPQGSS